MKYIFQFCPLQGISVKITNIPVVYMDQVLCLGVDYWFYTTDPPSISSSSDGQGVLRLENIRHGENKSEECSNYLSFLLSFSSQAKLAILASDAASSTESQ